MKTTLITIFAGMVLLVSAPDAFAQDDDDDLFGEGDGTSGDDDDGTGGDDGMGGDTGGDTGGGDTGGDAAAPVAVAGGMPASGTLGVGFGFTVGGVGGIEAEYWLTESLMAGGLARFQILAPEGGDTQLGITAGGQAFFVLKARDKAALLFGGRFLLGFTSGDAGTTSIAIEAPLRLHMQLHKNVSAHVEGGAVIAIGDQAALGGNPLLDFGFAVGAFNMFGNAGLTFYMD